MTFFKHGTMCVAVETGMPEKPVRVGYGPTPRLAVRCMSDVPVQSTGTDGGEVSALRWAIGAGWFGECASIHDLTRIDVDERFDMDSQMEVWE